MVKVLGIAFSARKRGNCLNSLEYVLTKLGEKGFEKEVVNIHDYEIKPCSHCNYECFAYVIRGKNEKCPIQDDVPKIYAKMQEADVIILAVPTYSGRAAGLYYAFAERAMGIFESYENFKNQILSKIIALIVIGNVPGGGDLAYHTVVLDHHDCKYPPLTMILQSAEYSQGSLYGKLLDDEKVRDRLDNLVERILNAVESKR